MWETALKLRDYFLGEGAVIRKAPAAFATAVLVGTLLLGVAIYAVVDRLYSSEAAGLRGANSQLDATIKSLQTTIQNQDRKLSDIRRDKPGTTPTGNSRVQFSGAKLFFSNKVSMVNVFLKNSGDAAAVGLRYGNSFEIANKELTATEINQRFDRIKEIMADIEKREVTTEFQPNDQFFYTIESGTEDTVRELVQKNMKYLYVMVKIEYTDSNVPPDAWRVTEICIYLWGGQEFHNCPIHNRVFLSQ